MRNSRSRPAVKGRARASQERRAPSQLEADRFPRRSRSPSRGRSTSARGRSSVRGPRLGARAGGTHGGGGRGTCLAPIVDPSVGKFEHSMVRAPRRSCCPSRTTSRRSTSTSARRSSARSRTRSADSSASIRIWKTGASTIAVEASLGLRFYLESFKRQVPVVEYFAGPTNSGKTHAGDRAACGKRRAASTLRRCGFSPSRFTNA